MLIIINNESSQILQHDIHVLENIKVSLVEDFQSETFQVGVTPCVIVCFLVVRAAINFNYKSKPFHEKVNDIVADDFLSVKIKAVKHLLVNLLPECDFGYIVSLAILACVTQKFSVCREVVDVMLFDSDTVDDGHFYKEF